MNQNKNRIVLFGTGALSKLLADNIKNNTEIIAFIDDYNKGSIEGIPVIGVDDLSGLIFDYVVVAFGDSIKGISTLKNIGVADDKIVGYSYSGMKYEDSILQNDNKRNTSLKIKDECFEKLFDLNRKEYYLCGMNVPVNQAVIEKDFVREQTLSFLAEEIYRKKLEGSVAEIGVAGGHFAQKINTVFSDRNLYLFDTFSGLAQQDKNKAIKMGWGEKQYALTMQAVPEEIVLQRMPNKDKCIIKKGYFPNSFDVDDQFVFISLDIDFYESTREGLEIIYPKLREGGYIMVHDFHNLSFTESREAVIDFCDTFRVSYVPIPDNGGSVVITK